MALAFAKILEKEAAALFPGERVIGIRRNALVLQRPVAPARPRFVEEIVLTREGGARFHLAVRGPVAGDAAFLHWLELETLASIGAVSVHLTFDAPNDVRAFYREHAALIGRSADEIFASHREMYSTYDALFGGLLDYYGAWFSAEGASLPLAAFDLTRPPPVRLSAQMSSYGPATILAYDKFEAFLLARQFPANIDHLKTLLWRFWNYHRPRRREEIARNVPFECATCRRFVSRCIARLAPDPCPAFGAYYVPICNRCASTVAADKPVAPKQQGS